MGKLFKIILFLTLTLTLTLSFQGCDIFEDDKNNNNFENLLKIELLSGSSLNSGNMNFTIDGSETKYFTAEAPLQFLYYWLTAFIEDDNDNVRSAPPYLNTVVISFPESVTLGLYTQITSDFHFTYYVDSAAGQFWKDDIDNSNFSLNLTEWGGPGGRAKGTFQGTLYYSVSSPQTITITDGSFDVIIQ